MEVANCKILKSLRMIGNDMIEITFENNVEIQVDDMKEAYTLLDAFTEGKRLKKLIITQPRTSILKAARAYGESEAQKRKKMIIAEALVVHSLPQKMAINFYLNFIKNDYPVRFFTDTDKAIEWLNNLS